MDKNVVGWFEIPTNDMERAIKFYETVFGFSFHRMQLLKDEMAFFPFVEAGTGTGGALVYNPEYYEPRDNGTLIYFTAPSGDVSNELAKVELAGGKVLMDKKQISPDHGYMGLILDSEGNRIGLHSRS